MLKRSRSSSLQLQVMEEGTSLLCQDSADQSPQAHDEPSNDMRNMALLVLLYAMQGVPLGLTLGSIPFLLKTRSSYTEVGVFSLASYPYSMKLLWSPLVDTIYSTKLGRRKSWILPIQLASGLLMIVLSDAAEYWLEMANISMITFLFFVLVSLAATQDIAVDGWALNLLSHRNVGHASTCQTIGINCGYFMSFTIFLALSDANFCNNYFRYEPKPKGFVTLSKYFSFWGWAYIIVTIFLYFKSEKPCSISGSSTNPKVESGYLSREMYDRNENPEVHEDATRLEKTLPEYEKPLRRRSSTPFGFLKGRSIKDKIANVAYHSGIEQMYRRLWAVAILKHVKLLTAVLLICRLGSITAEAVGVFKLMEKGVTREFISLVVLVEFPLELVFAVYAGRWASKGRPFSPWLLGYYLRLAMAASTTFLVACFPVGAAFKEAPMFYMAVIVVGILTSFASTMMFVAMGTFFARISDSSMGGTYLTLLNTISNFGSSWPKFFIFLLIDVLTYQTCKLNDNNESSFLQCHVKKSNGSSNPCTNAGGRCIMIMDGFYVLSISMVMIGILVGLFLSRSLHILETAEDDAWRA